MGKNGTGATSAPRIATCSKDDKSMDVYIQGKGTGQERGSVVCQLVQMLQKS